MKTVSRKSKTVTAVLLAMSLCPACLTAVASTPLESSRSEPGYSNPSTVQSQAPLDCNVEELATPAGCHLAYGNLGFTVQATTGGSINQLRVQPSGLSVDNREITAELDGTPYGAELADLDGNGWPEIYVYVSSAGSGSYGSLAAYAVNNGKSITPIYLQPLDQSPWALDGYMGHDTFAVEGNRLVRQFPIYHKADTNSAPTGGVRQLQYRLEPGEAGWVLKLDMPHPG